MINLSTITLGWAILERRDRRNALILLGVVVLSALLSAAMVVSFMPFLYVLAQPEIIHTSPFLKPAYDIFGFSSDFSFLNAIGIGSVLIILIAGAFQILRAYTIARFSQMRMHAISQRLLASYLSQPYEYFLTKHTGSLGTQILSEAQTVVNQFYRPVTEIIAALLTLVAILTVLVVVNPVVTFAALGLFGTLYGSVFLVSRASLRRAGQRRFVANKERFKIASEGLSGAKIIKLGGLEKVYEYRYSLASLAFTRAQILATVIGSVPQYFVQMLVFGGGIIFCLFILNTHGLAAASVSEIIPTVGVFAVAAARMMPELSKFFHSVTQVQGAHPAIAAIHRDLSLLKNISLYKPSNAVRLKDELQVKHVTYHYPSSEGRGGINDVSATIRAGERVGIVGGTGAGKTTFADVLLGLLGPSDGRLVSDGVEINKDNVRDWQRSVGYVPQQIFLKDGSVAENIAFGILPEEIDNERLESAARMAQIHEFIMVDLPQQYGTSVGESGVRLSGGQRQRIGIARALYNDVDIIVFDEATSALDNLTERDVMSAIDALPGNKTVVMIAHRLTTMKKCDRMLLFRKGQIVANGSWEELMRDDPEFRALVASGGGG